LKFRTIIVDDEALARERIRTLLAGDPEIEIVGECVDGKQAISTVANTAPDLIFLDVQMPEVDGFGVIEAMAGAQAQMPAVIFVTAHDQYAVRAFEAYALDYLLKSFNRKRFQAALNRAKEQLHQSRSGIWNERIAGLLTDLQSRQKHLTRLVVRSSGRIFFLRVDEINWIKAADNYVRIYEGRESHMIRETLQALESRLDPAKFARIHRSTMVNVDRIRELKPMFHGDYLVTLLDGTELTLSRNYRQNLKFPPVGQSV